MLQFELNVLKLCCLIIFAPLLTRAWFCSRCQVMLVHGCVIMCPFNLFCSLPFISQEELLVEHFSDLIKFVKSRACKQLTFARTHYLLSQIKH